MSKRNGTTRAAKPAAVAAPPKDAKTDPTETLSLADVSLKSVGRTLTGEQAAVLLEYALNRWEDYPAGIEPSLNIASASVTVRAVAEALDAIIGHGEADITELHLLSVAQRDALAILGLLEQRSASFPRSLADGYRIVVQREAQS